MAEIVSSEFHEIEIDGGIAGKRATRTYREAAACVVSADFTPTAPKLWEHAPRRLDPAFGQQLH
jgi:hypothetical protein